MNVQKLVGFAFVLLGAGIVVMGAESLFAGHITEGAARLSIYTGAGGIGIGGLLVDSSWVFSMAKQCSQFLPWNKNGPPQ